MKAIIITLGVLLSAGCEVLDPPRATTLSPVPMLGGSAAPTASDSFSNLSLPYPAARISERSQVPVGDYLRSALKKALPNALITVKAWEPKADVRGLIGPKVAMTLGFEFEVQLDQKVGIVADYFTSEIGSLYISHRSITGLHSIESRERPAPIHDQLRTFLDAVIEKVKWRLRETGSSDPTSKEPEPAPGAVTPSAARGSSK